MCSRLGAPGWSVGALILTWAEGTDSTCSPTPAILRRGLRAPGTSLLTWSPAPAHGFPTLFQKLCSAEGWTVSRRPRPACGRAAGWHCWFYGNNDTSSIYFPSETILVGAGLRCSSCRTARDREQRAAVELSLCCKCRPPSPMSSHSFGLTTDQGHGPVQQILHGHRHELRAGLRRLRVWQRHKHLRSSKLGLLQSDHLLC